MVILSSKRYIKILETQIHKWKKWAEVWMSQNNKFTADSFSPLIGPL